MSSGDELKTPDTSPFTLKSDAAFGSRVGDVFGCLGHIEAKHNAYQKARSSSRNDDDGDDGSGLIKDDPQDDFLLAPGGERTDVLSVSSWKSPSEKQSFKRPRDPAPRSRTCPDYKLNPGKWTYYNLEDVSPDSMSEQSNTEAAASFLSSINPGQQSKKQKLNPDDTATSSSDVDKETSPPKVIFRKPAKKDIADETKAQMSSEARTGVNVMPEYVIGQKITTRKSRPGKGALSSQSAAAVTISHVMDSSLDEDDDDDDDEDSPDSDPSLRAKPTRTVFSGCEKEQLDDVKPMDTDQSFFGFLSKKSKTAKKVMRCRRESDSDDDKDDKNSKLSKDEKNLEGVD